MASFEVITDVERFAPAKDVPSFYGFYRAYELHRGDEFYCNTDAMKKLDKHYIYYGSRKPGDHIALYFKEDNIAFSVIVTKVFKEKKYPNKKWWQFWLKQEETVTGYHLMVV